MSLHRVMLVALATLFAAGTASAASACCDLGYDAPFDYAPGCGGCGTPAAAIIFAQPVAPTPPPIVPDPWGNCGCGSGPWVVRLVAEPTLLAPAPIYVVDQGPDFTGPGIMIPYRTWTPAVAPGWSYPFIPGYGFGRRYHYRFSYGGRGRRLASGLHMYSRGPKHIRPRWHSSH